MDRTINFEVHPTPMKPGDSVQTYHVRQSLKSTMRTDELADYLAQHGLISKGVFLMVMEQLKKELADLLLSGHDVHLDGIGRFALQLGVKKVPNEEGKLVRKTFQSPDELTGHDLTIEGITFVPDRDMLDRLHSRNISFHRVKRNNEQNVSPAQLLTILDLYCREHGSFTRKDVQYLFGVTRYRAQQLLDELVCAPAPKFYREKHGPSYIYRKKGT